MIGDFQIDPTRNYLDPNPYNPPELLGLDLTCVLDFFNKIMIFYLRKMRPHLLHGSQEKLIDISISIMFSSKQGVTYCYLASEIFLVNDKERFSQFHNPKKPGWGRPKRTGCKMFLLATTAKSKAS